MAKTAETELIERMSTRSRLAGTSLAHIGVRASVAETGQPRLEFSAKDTNVGSVAMQAITNTLREGMRDGAVAQVDGPATREGDGGAEVVTTAQVSDSFLEAFDESTAVLVEHVGQDTQLQSLAA